MHMHTYSHACTDARAYTHAQPHLNALAHARNHTCTHQHANTHTHDARTHTHTSAHKRTRASTCTHNPVHNHARVWARTHAHTRTHVQTYNHTHTRIYMHICTRVRSCRAFGALPVPTFLCIIIHEHTYNYAYIARARLHARRDMLDDNRLYRCYTTLVWSGTLRQYCENKVRGFTQYASHSTIHGKTGVSH